MKQFLIAVDQLINTMVYAKHEGFGMCDETLSARAYRLGANPFWDKVVTIIDLILGPNHCAEAYRAECERLQLPTKYCDGWL
jgi:hypothetical protein